MKPVLSAPDITAIDRLWEIYQSLPDRDKQVSELYYFYDFLCKNTIERKKFLDTYCDYEFVRVGETVILKLSPKR